MPSKLDLILTEIKKLQNQGDARFELMKEEFALVRSEMGTEISSLRSEMGSEISSLRSEMGTEISSLRSEMGSEISSLRSEMRQGFAGVALEFKEVRKDLAIIRNQTANLTERVTALENRC